MRRTPLAFLVLVGCSGTGEDDGPPPPPRPCLFTAEPAAVSFEVTPDADVDVACALRRVDINDTETVLVLAPCTGTTDSATVAIGSVPALSIDVTEGEALDLVFERADTRRITVRRGADLVLAGSTGRDLPNGAFAPLAITAKAGGCEPEPQTCAGGTFTSDRQILTITGAGAPMEVPTRHAFDDGARHVRVQQADRFSDRTSCGDIPEAWFDFVVALDRS